MALRQITGKGLLEGRGDIGREAGVATSQLSYFLSGQRDLTLTTAGKLFKALGLELVAKRPRPRKEK